MKTNRKLRLQAAELAVRSPRPDGVNDAAYLLSLTIMWECYLKLGADETQKRLQLLPEDTATILELVQNKP